MVQINVDAFVIKTIREKLERLWDVADKGYLSCSRALEQSLQEMREFYQKMSCNISLLKAEALRLERNADAQQQEYDRQCREMQEGKTNVIPYDSPDMKRKEARQKRQQAERMETALEEYHQKCKSFKGIRDRFLSEFGKIAGSGDTEGDRLGRALEKIMDSLYEYDRTL